MSESELQILGISGSLRAGSYNTAALRGAQRLAPQGMRIDTFDIAPVPPYNEDVRQQGFPQSVQQLREAIAAADGVLIATPEYNYSVPGVLKNAIDWASRPPEQPLAQKPIAIMGASPSGLGTGRAQYHLRQSFVFLDAFVMNKPEVMIAAAHQKFDDNGELQDETTRQFIGDLVQALGLWIARVRAGSKAAQD